MSEETAVLVREHGVDHEWAHARDGRPRRRARTRFELVHTAVRLDDAVNERLLKTLHVSNARHTVESAAIRDVDLEHGVIQLRRINARDERGSQGSCALKVRVLAEQVAGDCLDCRAT